MDRSWCSCLSIIYPKSHIVSRSHVPVQGLPDNPLAVHLQYVSPSANFEKMFFLHLLVLISYLMQKYRALSNDQLLAQPVLQFMAG